MRFLKILIVLILIFSFSEKVLAQPNRYPIIPQPTQFVAGDGDFFVNKKTKISIDFQSHEMKDIAKLLLEDLAINYNLNISFTDKASSNVIAFVKNTSLKKEAYKLVITKKKVSIEYAEPTGAFYAVQTIRQLLFNNTIKAGTKITLPILQVIDMPKMSYRGYMLDVSRHFFPIDHLKKTIDALAYYKINVFHLHLTDDQGWRVEIKKYPKLHEIGGWRKETQIGHRTDYPVKFDGIPHGGYYTQKELKELVEYAKSRFIRIIPEIDIPGHAQAILAAYPQFGCIDTTYHVATTWGIFNNILCPKEETFKFLNDVFDEIMSIFPDKYIHIGGDEVMKKRWIESAFCQNLMGKLDLKNEDELQSYFVKRVESYLNADGREIIGWDEILEGGIAPGATIMSWRGEKGGIEAAKKGHNVIMVPSAYLYLNFYNTTRKKELEPLCNTNALPLKKIYDYSPYPKQLSENEQSYVIGMQGCLWTEYCKTTEQADQLTFPRMCAVAETSWNGGEKDFDDFYKRLKVNIPALKYYGVKYSELFLLPENNHY